MCRLVNFLQLFRFCRYAKSALSASSASCRNSLIFESDSADFTDCTVQRFTRPCLLLPSDSWSRWSSARCKIQIGKGSVSFNLLAGSRRDFTSVYQFYYATCAAPNSHIHEREKNAWPFAMGFQPGSWSTEKTRIDLMCSSHCVRNWAFEVS